MSGFFAGFNIPLTGSGPNIGITSAQGINGAQQIVGFYQDSLSHLHGFLLSGGAFAVPRVGRSSLRALTRLQTFPDG
jgi:hypothetical protein